MQIVTVQGSAAATPEEAIGRAIQDNMALGQGAADFMIVPGGLTQTDDGFVATVNFMLLSEDDIPMMQEMRRRAQAHESAYGQDHDQLDSGDLSDEEHSKIQDEKRGQMIDQEMHGFEETVHMIHSHEKASERASEQIAAREEDYEHRQEERSEEIEEDFDIATHDNDNQAASVDRTAEANGLSISPAPGLGDSGNSGRSAA